LSSGWLLRPALLDENRLGQDEQKEPPGGQNHRARQAGDGRRNQGRQRSCQQGEAEKDVGVGGVGNPRMPNARFPECFVQHE
jgi:hypothetical protein